jgi:hypothetical protein
MSTATLPEVREGYFPHWKLKTTGVIMPDERLPWGQTIASGLQHRVAMAGGTIIGPLLMGFDPNLALLFSGIGTLIFFVVVAGRVPSYLGSSTPGKWPHMRVLVQPRSMVARKNASRRDQIHDPNNSDYRGERPSSMADDRCRPGTSAFSFVRG